FEINQRSVRGYIGGPTCPMTAKKRNQRVIHVVSVTHRSLIDDMTVTVSVVLKLRWKQRCTKLLSVANLRRDRAQNNQHQGSHINAICNLHDLTVLNWPRRPGSAGLIGCVPTKNLLIRLVPD